MKIHPREKLINESERILREATARLYDLELTKWERIQVINRVLSDAIASSAKYAIRVERHGDAGTPGGLA